MAPTNIIAMRNSHLCIPCAEPLMIRNPPSTRRGQRARRSISFPAAMLAPRTSADQGAGRLHTSRPQAWYWRPGDSGQRREMRYVMPGPPRWSVIT